MQHSWGLNQHCSVVNSPHCHSSNPLPNTPPDKPQSQWGTFMTDELPVNTWLQLQHFPTHTKVIYIDQEWLIAAVLWISCNQAYSHWDSQTFLIYTCTATPKRHWSEEGNGRHECSALPHTLSMARVCPLTHLRSAVDELLSKSLLNEAADCSCCELNTTSHSHHSAIKPLKACKYLTAQALCKLSRAVRQLQHAGLWWLNLCGIKMGGGLNPEHMAGKRKR